MTVEATVAAFVRSVKPQAMCDDCIAKRLRLGSGSNRVMARNATAGLSQTKDFTRAKGVCSKCGKQKLVTHAN
ncbi:MAG: hypothetical protein NTW68_15295 [candidate division NC10 bacterium]|nr:hypothetical protein [candidate division NC10 bacterium]